MQNLIKSHYFIRSLVAAWFVLVVTGLVYFQLGQLKPFDATDMLIQPHWFERFQQQQVINHNKMASLVIITEQNCGCTQQAQAHITTLQALAKSKGLAIQQVSLSQQLKQVIPATPAAVIIDSNGNFVYAGPLSEGLACSQGSGFVESVIHNLAAGFNSQLLITDTKGCYCTTEKGSLF